MTGDTPRDAANSTGPHTAAKELAGLASTKPLLEQAFDEDTLYALRSAVAAHATQAGLSEGRASDLGAAAHELAANAVRHGGGAGRLRLWNHDQVLHCQVSDEGPDGGSAEQDTTALWGTTPGSGLWLVRRLADHMHLQTGPYGTIAAISLTLGPPDRRSEFQIREDDHGHCMVLTVTGELDLRSAPTLTATINAAIDATPTPRLVLDLTRLTFWDSSGIAALITAQQRINTAPGARLVLAGLSQQLRRRLRTMGLTDRFALAETARQAVRKLSSSS
jgi:anti-anti-sigma factor